MVRSLCSVSYAVQSATPEDNIRPLGAVESFLAASANRWIAEGHRGTRIDRLWGDDGITVVSVAASQGNGCADGCSGNNSAENPQGCPGYSATRSSHPGQGIHLLDRSARHLSLIRRRNLDAEVAGDSIWRKPDPCRNTFRVREEHDASGAIGEHAARPGIGQQKRDDNARHGPVILVDDLDDRISRCSLADIVNRALSLKDLDC